MDGTFIIRREKNNRTFYVISDAILSWGEDVAQAHAFSEREAKRFVTLFNANKARVKRHGKAIAETSASVLMGHAR